GFLPVMRAASPLRSTGIRLHRDSSARWAADDLMATPTRPARLAIDFSKNLTASVEHRRQARSAATRNSRHNLQPAQKVHLTSLPRRNCTPPPVHESECRWTNRQK